jgi:hypothetical protein
VFIVPRAASMAHQEPKTTSQARRPPSGYVCSSWGSEEDVGVQWEERDVMITFSASPSALGSRTGVLHCSDKDGVV